MVLWRTWHSSKDLKEVRGQLCTMKGKKAEVTGQGRSRCTVHDGSAPGEMGSPGGSR